MTNEANKLRQKNANFVSSHFLSSVVRFELVTKGCETLLISSCRVVGNPERSTWWPCRTLASWSGVAWGTTWPKRTAYCVLSRTRWSTDGKPRPSPHTVPAPTHAAWPLLLWRRASWQGSGTFRGRPVPHWWRGQRSPIQWRSRPPRPYQPGCRTPADTTQPAPRSPGTAALPRLAVEPHRSSRASPAAQLRGGRERQKRKDKKRWNDSEHAE